MNLRLGFLVVILLWQCRAIACNSNKVRNLPGGLILGSATSSYQVEGAWNADGKSVNIYDHITHTNSCYSQDCSNGDVACNSYYKYKRDVEMLRELGFEFYRFSLSWTRILPTSFPDKINKAGVQYYNNLIDELLKHGIEPVVTIFHWDLPQKLQDMGGWTNPYIVDWFGDYARVVFDLFGDRVKYWVTINEPHQICYWGYGNTLLAPALNIKGVAEYLCSKNLLLAHARAYHIYDKVYRRLYNGSIFITINAEWYEPVNKHNKQSAYDSNQFVWGQYAHPIFSAVGDYPAVMKERIAKKSREQGFFRSRLPSFTPEEILYIRGTSDMFGLNHYSSHYTYRNGSEMNYFESPSFGDDLGVRSFQPSEWQIGKANVTMFAPWGFYNLLTEIRKAYHNIPVFITENGFGNYRGMNDDDRVTYYRNYLYAVLDAIEDGSKIVGYTVWSLMDNFEWFRGYTICYGLYQVDFKDPDRTRTPRKSAYVFKEIMRTRSINMSYEPDVSIPLTIDEGYY
ncbi:unnamed protein product [Colias eurytheme]|nr:unnamed protein product [Colias eurytheme]